MIEPLHPYALTSAETEIIEILRLAHMAAFSLSTSHRDGVFTVKLVNLDASKFLEGHGPTFDEAWRALFSADLRGMGLDLQDRIAAQGLKLSSSLTVLEGGRA